MERKLVRNKTEFIQLCKHWREAEGYYYCIREDDITGPSEYPCMILIEEQISKDGSDWCNFHYVYKSDFNGEEFDDAVRLDDYKENCIMKRKNYENYIWHPIVDDGEYWLDDEVNPKIDPETGKRIYKDNMVTIVTNGEFLFNHDTSRFGWGTMAKLGNWKFMRIKLD